MEKSIPLFKTHYSIGRSVLTSDKHEESIKNGAKSIFQLAEKYQLKNLFVVDNSMAGYKEIYDNSKKYGLNLRYGVRINVVEDSLQKDDESHKKTCKFIIFIKSSQGYKDLIKIYSHSYKEENFYYEPRIDYKTLKAMWNDESLLLAVPFYDSFIFKNLLYFSKCIPDISFTNPMLFLENNSLPFDSLVREQVIKFAESEKLNTVEAKTVYYEKKEDFTSYLALRCIDKRSTVQKPNLDHFSSDEFCLESLGDNYER